MHRHTRAQIVAARRTWVARRILRWRRIAGRCNWHDHDVDEFWRRAYGHGPDSYRRQPGRFSKKDRSQVYQAYYLDRDDYFLEGRRRPLLRLQRQERLDYGRAFGRRYAVWP